MMLATMVVPAKEERRDALMGSFIASVRDILKISSF